MSPKPPNQVIILNKSSLLISILAATVLFIIAVLIIEQRRNYVTAQLRLELSSELKRVNAHINSFLDDLYSGLAATTRIIDNDGSVNGFEEAAQQILTTNKFLNNISLIPNGVIKYTAPESNKGAIDKNILYALDKEEAAAALSAFRTRKIKIAGPIKNFEQVDCITARLPIFIAGQFWGFSSAVIRLDEMLQTSGILDRKNSKYHYSISYISYQNGAEVFFLSQQPPAKSITVEEEMSHINWKLYISSAKSRYQLFLFPALLSLLGSVLVGFLIKKWLDKTARLQFLIQQKDQQIADTEKEFRAIFENAPIGFAIIDAESGSISSANQKFNEIFGIGQPVSSEDGNHRANSFHLDNLKKIPTIVNDVNTPLFGEYKHVNPRGEEIWTNYKLFALPPALGSHLKYIVIAEDVTEKLSADRKIKESEKKYKHLFEESPVALWEEDFSEVVAALTRNGMMGKSEEEAMAYFNSRPNALPEYIGLVRIKSINDECFRQYNYSSKEELLRHFPQTIAYQPNLIVIKKILVAICARRHQFKSESEFLNAQGELRNSILSWQVIPGHEENYEQVILTTVDITDLKKSREDLNRSMEILDQQNKRLLDFSYIVSHNLRSHISNIQSLSELMLSSNSQEERKELTEHLHHVVTILSSTIDALNDVVTTNADLNLSRQDILLKETADKTINVLRDKIKQKEAVILNNIPKHTTIFYNKAYIESILLNLVSNSLRYSKPNVCPIVSLNYTEINSEKVLTVSDNGIGIDLEQNGHKLFGLFKTFTHNPESKGIGLYITKRQIEALGGKITVESTVNVGSTFKIYFR